MPEVKGVRKRSAQTKGRIVEVALPLFAERGYSGTTFQQVADAAGVSVQTVYFHYGSKSQLLKHAMDVASAGDDEPVPLLDRPWFTDLRNASDPMTVVQGWVHQSGLILDRVASLLATVRDAAAGDPEMSDQWEANSAQRRIAHGAFVAILNRMQALRPGLTERKATDITVGLLSPDLFLVLTRECGWATSQWERWAVDHVSHGLLPRRGLGPRAGVDFAPSALRVSACRRRSFRR